MTPEATKIETVLLAQTQSLKEQYIAKVTEWAFADFKRIFARCLQYTKSLSTDYPTKHDYYDAQRWYHNTGLAIVNGGQDKYVTKQIKLAEEHYTSSIQKLALRIEAKGMNQDTLQIMTSHIGVNIESIFTDGTQTVRAWTIIASGPIQRPHYRYLIK